VAKAAGKRAYHREDMKKVNRTALMIGGGMAVLILLAMLLSFM